jgi:2-polyprenyl-3-methyl-5-hydroxy-6-metoxy-1,4-benzoquinol methylase
MATNRTETISCRICQNSVGNRIFTAREMMFGSRETFDYIECASCGCLQIIEIPSDIEKYYYYPQTFYSLEIRKNPKKKPIRTYLRRQRSKFCLSGKNKTWPLHSTRYGSFRWFKKTKITFDSKILDVGCGYGKLLFRMQRDGFLNLTGVDPYIKEDISYRNGVKVFKKHVFELNGQYDLIMSHHSLEHMPQPLDVLKKIYELLKPNRYAIIRIPIASSYSWRHYGVNWVALDAPRHLFSHTTKSMQLLSKKAGFIVADIDFDSTERQFIISELYSKGIALKDSNYYLRNPRRSIFSKEQIEAFKAKAIELNAKGDGDQACFYLYKA